MSAAPLATETPRVDVAVPGAHSFAAALCGFLGSTAATTLVMVLLSTL
jgi:ascorbate-specific PTS system EIIC-type component UlaA